MRAEHRPIKETSLSLNHYVILFKGVAKIASRIFKVGFQGEVKNLSLKEFYITFFAKYVDFYNEGLARVANEIVAQSFKLNE